jgi:sulfur relay (sulfurtransferase) DsrC/TusE family protein
MTVGVLTLAGGREIEIDEKGYLIDRSDWDLSIAEHMAGEDGVIEYFSCLLRAVRNRASNASPG